MKAEGRSRHRKDVCKDQGVSRAVGSLGLGKVMERTPPEPPKGVSAADARISYFWPPELEENTLLLLYGPRSLW